MFSPGSAVTQQGKIIALSVHLHFFDLSCNPLLGIAVKTTLLEKRSTDGPIFSASSSPYQDDFFLSG